MVVMTKLADVDVDDLEAALDDATGKQETERLLVAIIYKRGPSVPMIAEWLDRRERTIYDWLDRLENRPIEDAVTDDQRSGRPPKLTAAERESFEATVREPPIAAGYDQSAWTTALAREFVSDRFDVDYSRRTIQRLLTDAGLRHETADGVASADATDDRRVFWETIEKGD
jgi:transposase